MTPAELEEERTVADVHKPRIVRHAGDFCFTLELKPLWLPEMTKVARASFLDNLKKHPDAK